MLNNKGDVMRSGAMRLAAVATAALALNGCALFVPFESEFMCERTNEFGQCITVEGAYDQAVGGVSHAKPTDSRRERNRRRRGEVLVAGPDAEAHSRYRAAEYERMLALMDQPVAPLVRPPKVLQTLVVAYSASDRTLFSPRFIYYFADHGGFLFGDYLNAPPEGGAPMLHPVGERR